MATSMPGKHLTGNMGVNNNGNMYLLTTTDEASLGTDQNRLFNLRSIEKVT